jgi:hypothetical protein
MAPLRADETTRLTFDIGGGVTTPLNPTAQYVGVSGNFVAGAGYDLNRSNAIIGQFMWAGLPPNVFIRQPVGAPYGNVNLYALTANYRHTFKRFDHSPFAAYFIGGGGWYYRHASIDRNYVVPPSTTCTQVYSWWGFGCDPNGYVYTTTIESRGLSAGGVNAGLGFTVRISDSGLRIFVESRYHYAFHPRFPTTLIPVTFGIRFN